MWLGFTCPLTFLSPVVFILLNVRPMAFYWAVCIRDRRCVCIHMVALVSCVIVWVFSSGLRWKALRGEEQALYYFLTEIYVQSSTVAQRGLISEGSNLSHGFDARVERSTTTPSTQSSRHVMDDLDLSGTPAMLFLDHQWWLYRVLFMFVTKQVPGNWCWDPTVPFFPATLLSLITEMSFQL